MNATRNVKRLRLAILASVLLLALQPAAAETAQPATDARHQAVIELLNTAAEQVEQGRLEAASATLERALRIDPQDGEIWHLLGQVRWQQGEAEQARALAAKSNALSADNARLRERNARLLALATPPPPAAVPTPPPTPTAEPTPTDAAAPTRIVASDRLRRSKQALAQALAATPALPTIPAERQLDPLIEQLRAAARARRLGQPLGAIY